MIDNFALGQLVLGGADVSHILLVDEFENQISGNTHPIK